MSKINISFIGTTKITNHHIISAKYNNFKIHSICSVTKKSKFLLKIAKKHKIKKTYRNIKKMIEETSNIKNFAYVLTCNEKYNDRIINLLRKTKKKILIEKPVFKNYSLFKKNNISKKFIFVGFNRTTYLNLIYLKKKFKKEKLFNVVCSIPENNNKDIINNSCHTISILFMLFGELKIDKILGNKFFKTVLLKSNNSSIIINFNFGAPENFEIKIFNKNIVYQLKPLERLQIFDKIKLTKKNNLNFYEPSLSYDKFEPSLKEFKPGFIKQYFLFKQFILNDNLLDENSFDRAKKIYYICEKISKF